MWNKSGKTPISQYLCLTFLIAWGCEAVLILGEHLGILTGTVGVIITFLVIGFGAGFAPAYATIILLKKHAQIQGGKDLLKLVIKVDNVRKTIFITAILFFSQLLINIFCNDYLGEPWYLFVLYLPVMVIGGGIEEIGWRGFLQPALEEKFPFFMATFITGIVWAIWHLPLWFIQNANQSSMNFLSFLLHCISMGFVLAALYKFTKSVFACIILHAWSNVLNGMFTIDTLINPPDAKQIIIYIFEIMAVIVVCNYNFNRNKTSAKKM